METTAIPAASVPDDAERAQNASSSLWTDTTRYLCAAAHLDTGFRNRIFANIVDEEHRAIAPSYGIDIAAVVMHCRAAKRRETIRDAWLAVLFVPVLISVLSALNTPDYGLPVLLSIVFFAVAYAIVFHDRWTVKRSIVAATLTKDRYDPEGLRARFRTDLDKHPNTFREIDSVQHGNVIVYSGYSPFVGSGAYIGGWSFALNAHKAKEDMGKFLTPVSFEVEDLYNHLTQKMGDLSLEEICTEDKLIVGGKEIRSDRRFLPGTYGPPRYYIDPQAIGSFVESNNDPARRYKCVRVMSWKGQLVLSIFVRFLKKGQSFFAEANYFLLPPLKNNYSNIDSINPYETWRDVVSMAMECIFIAPLRLIISPLFVLAKLSEVIDKLREEVSGESSSEKQIRRMIEDNQSFDYGAKTSIREQESSSQYRQYFQRLDKEMYLKIIERQILDSIIGFLDEKNVDTSDLKERQTAILNSGVIISGGTINARNLAVGESATATTQQNK